MLNGEVHEGLEGDGLGLLDVVGDGLHCLFFVVGQQGVDEGDVLVALIFQTVANLSDDETDTLVLDVNMFHGVGEEFVLAHRDQIHVKFAVHFIKVVVILWVFSGAQAVEPAAELPQNAFIKKVQRGLDHIGLHTFPHLEDLADILHGDFTHHHPALGDDLYQVFLFDFIQSLTDGGAAGADLLDEAFFVQKVARHIFTTDDFIFNDAVGPLLQTVFLFTHDSHPFFAMYSIFHMYIIRLYIETYNGFFVRNGILIDK